MSLKDIRSECSDVAGLLQPYVDAELNEQEQESVAAHLTQCSGCRAAVSEQAWVRATLRAIDREPAPQALRAKVLLGLDEIDREQAAEAASSAPPGLGARLWSRLREFGRGGLIMVPAGAVAAGLFVMAQQGSLSPEPSPPAAVANSAPGLGLGGAIVPAPEAKQPAGDEDMFRAIAGLEPQVGFRVQVPRTSDPRSDLQLVSASLDRPGNETPAARLRYQLPTGGHLVDRQLPAGAMTPRGTAYDVSGRSYHLHRDDAGQAVLSFEVGGVAHVLILEDGRARPDDRASVSPARPEFELLLKFAARLADR